MRGAVRISRRIRLARLHALRGAAAVALLLLGSAAQAQVTGSPQLQRLLIPVPEGSIFDSLSSLDAARRQARDAFEATKTRMQDRHGLTWSLQASWFLQSATPDGGRPVSQFVCGKRARRPTTT